MSASVAINMHYCYDCQKAFPRLRDLRKHERVHRHRGHCADCDVYFTSKEKEEEHHRELHTRSFGTQTDPVSMPAKRSRPVTKDYRRRPHYKDYRRRPQYSHPRRWEPAARSSKPTPAKEVSSIAVSKSAIFKAEESDIDIDLNDTTDLCF